MVLHHVHDSNFPNDMNFGLFKSWIVPIENRQPFSCIGLKVYTIWRMEYPYAKVKNIQMWEDLSVEANAL